MDTQMSLVGQQTKNSRKQDKDRLKKLYTSQNYLKVFQNTVKTAIYEFNDGKPPNLEEANVILQTELGQIADNMQ